jgi:hypothetical protein
MLASHLRRHSKELINENNMFSEILVILAQRKLLSRRVLASSRNVALTPGGKVFIDGFL